MRGNHLGSLSSLAVGLDLASDSDHRRHAERDRAGDDQARRQGNELLDQPDPDANDAHRDDQDGVDAEASLGGRVAWREAAQVLRGDTAHHVVAGAQHVQQRGGSDDDKHDAERKHDFHAHHFRDP